MHGKELNAISTIPRMDKQTGGGHALADDRQDVDLIAYWLSRPPHERLAEVERLRRLYHGEDYATASRLRRSDLRLERRAG